MEPDDLEQPVLRQLPYRDGIIYGPIISRRLGRSLGINLLAEQAKVCSFDCVYCQFPRAKDPSKWKRESLELLGGEALLGHIEAEMLRLKSLGSHYDSITFSGNGDASAHPEFPDVARLAHRLRARLFPESQLTVFTNGVWADRPAFRSALELFDNAFLKVDAGTKETLAAINRPQTDMDLESSVRSLSGIAGLAFQTMLCKGTFSNQDSIMSDAYLQLVELGRPKAIHLYTVNKLPAFRAVAPLTEQELVEASDWLRTRVDIPVLHFMDDCTSGFPDDPRLKDVS